MTYQRPNFERDPWAETVRAEYRSMAMTELCNGCDAERGHPAYPDCRICGGSGHVIGGDEYRACSTCRVRSFASPFTRRALASELPPKVVAA